MIANIVYLIISVMVGFSNWEQLWIECDIFVKNIKKGRAFFLMMDLTLMAHVRLPQKKERWIWYNQSYILSNEKFSLLTQVWEVCNSIFLFIFNFVMRFL